MKILMVRSQNKESIRQACEFRINSRDNMFMVTAITARGTVENLGSYTTYEKAMKVMDMIQWHLDEGVFEMPSDDDVEELYSSCEALFDY